MNRDRAHLDHGIWRLVNGADDTIGRWYRQVATRSALMACSDRVLADIGIERENIPAIARASSGRGGGQVFDWRDALARRLERMRQRRRVYRELMAYSDSELDELGIGRGDIPGIARSA
jgi:uncharacterized protein YjiS (DUF1127 family)